MFAFRQILWAVLGILIIILIGTFGYVLIEGLTFFDALWMTSITIFSVGYGDVVPHTYGGKLFTIFLIPFGLGLVFYTLGAIAGAVIEGHFSRSWGKRKMNKKIAELKDHIIICGYGRVGQQVIEQLERQDVPFVVVEQNEEHVEKIADCYLVVKGDATEDEVLRTAGITHARGLIAALPQDAANVFISLTAKGLNPDIHVVARAEKFESEEKLRRAGADKVINPSSIGGRRMAMSILKPASVEYVDTLLHSGQMEINVEEIFIGRSSEFAGKSLAENRIRDQWGINVLALRREQQIVSNPGPDEVLLVGDLVIVFGTRENLLQFEKAAVGGK